MAGKVRNLRLPDARVDDRPWRQEKDCPFPAAEDLVMDLDAAAVDVALLVWVPCPHLRVCSSPSPSARSGHRSPPRSATAFLLSPVLRADAGIPCRTSRTSPLIRAAQRPSAPPSRLAPDQRPRSGGRASGWRAFAPPLPSLG